jgi:aryl-alcohol dehydrogenase-like predicted oxidoreductase
MLYRNLINSGMALSEVGVRLNWECVNHNAEALKQLLVSALEFGINSYHFDYIERELMQTAQDVFAQVKRNLLFISATAYSQASQPAATSYDLIPLRERLKLAIKDTKLDYLDLLMFDRVDNRNLNEETWAFLKKLRFAQMVKHFGAEADESNFLELINAGQFQVLRTDYNIDISWEKRHLVDKAIASGISVIGKNYFPEHCRLKEKSHKFNMFGKAENPLEQMGAYAFLFYTHGWYAQDICLAYALHQNNLTCIHVEVANHKQLAALAGVPERYLPNSIPAQIEMNRISESKPLKRA